MLFNFGKDGGAKNTLVCGYAGSGKSTICNELADRVLYHSHDVWVSSMYESDEYTIDYITTLIPDAVVDGKVIKSVILNTILNDSVIGKLLSSYWRSEYNKFIKTSLDYEGCMVVEIPYYDEELHSIVMENKQYFNIHVVDTPRSVCYDRLKEIRKWSEFRIAMTLGMQDTMYAYMRKVLPFCDHQPMLCYTKGSGEKCFRTCCRCGVEIKYDGIKFSEVFR